MGSISPINLISLSLYPNFLISLTNKLRPRSARLLPRGRAQLNLQALARPSPR
jgi:hypothetical protein